MRSDWVSVLWLFWRVQHKWTGESLQKHRPQRNLKFKKMRPAKTIKMFSRRYFWRGFGFFGCVCVKLAVSKLNYGILNLFLALFVTVFSDPFEYFPFDWKFPWFKISKGKDKIQWLRGFVGPAHRGIQVFHQDCSRCKKIHLLQYKNMTFASSVILSHSHCTVGFSHLYSRFLDDLLAWQSLTSRVRTVASPQQMELNFGQ